MRRGFVTTATIVGALMVFGIGADSCGETDDDDGGNATPIVNDDLDAALSAEPEPEAEPDDGLTPSQRNAVRAAESYLEFQAFSRQGLIDQLSSEYGSQFPLADATFAVDSLNVNWNEQAAKSAASYLEFQAFSCQGLIDQLSSEYGSQFTVAQAQYGAAQAGIC